MALVALPAELLALVAEALPHPSLAALARTAARLRPVAQRVLFRHLLVVCPGNAALVPLLASSPHLARHVRVLFVAAAALSPICPPFYDMLAKALRNMSDLHSLDLRVDASASWLLRDLPAYPSLVRFSSSFALDEHVVRFLQHTPALLELGVDSLPHTSPIPALPASSIPHLDQFTGSSRAASVIVPGRPVRSIYLCDTCPTEDDLPMLARSIAPVSTLSAVTNASPIAFLRLVHRHFPHLAYLRVMSQNFFPPPTIEFYEQVADAFSLFSNLNLELCGMHWCPQRKRDPKSKRVWQSSPLPTSPLPSEDADFSIYVA